MQNLWGQIMTKNITNRMPHILYLRPFFVIYCFEHKPFYILLNFVIFSFSISTTKQAWI